MKVHSYLAIVVLVALAAPLFAQQAAVTPKTAGEVGNLDANFPTQLVDTTTIPQGKFEIGLSAGYENYKEGKSLLGDVYGSAIPTVTYGIMPNLQAMFSMPTRIGEGVFNYNIGVAGNTDRAANFDTDWGLLWRINEEGDVLPSFGIGLSVKAPTGYGATGWDGTALGVITKSFGPVRVSANASYTGIDKPKTWSVWEHHLDSFGLGASFPVMDNLVLVTDVYTSEHPWTSWPSQRINVAEVGARYAMTESDILSAGFGFGFGPGSMTPTIIATVGYQKLL